MDIKTIKSTDERFPKALLEIAKPLKELYYIGNIDLLSLPCVAMVGGRTPTEEAKERAGQYSRELASAGAVIVSGFAGGIDNASHRGALEVGGATIAVMACGLDRPQSKKNTALMKEFIEKGCLIISEYPEGTIAFKSNFLKRNRIVSAISQEVIVVECKKEGGTMDTVGHARTQGRNLWTFETNQGNPQGSGNIQLISEGAKICSSSKDILVSLGITDSAIRKICDVREKYPQTFPEQRDITRDGHE